MTAEVKTNIEKAKIGRYENLNPNWYKLRPIWQIFRYFWCRLQSYVPQVVDALQQPSSQDLSVLNNNNLLNIILFLYSDAGSIWYKIHALFDLQMIYLSTSRYFAKIPASVFNIAEKQFHIKSNHIIMWLWNKEPATCFIHFPLIGCRSQYFDLIAIVYQCCDQYWVLYWWKMWIGQAGHLHRAGHSN